MIICASEQCTGCGGCYSVCPVRAITMTPDEKGFLCPLIDNEKCINCMACVEHCHINKNPALSPDSEYEQQVYACAAKNTDVRLNSSSGGIVSLLASEVFSCGGAVAGAIFDDKFHLYEELCTSKEDFEARGFRRSKYVQSDTRDCFIKIRAFLEEYKAPLLFVGTPCLLAGLQSFLGKEYGQLLLVDFVCHGVPSPAVFQAYLRYQEKKHGSETAQVDFRIKSPSWTLSSIRVRFKNNKEYICNALEDPYCVGFGNGIFLRDCCYDCKYTNPKRISDLTLCDYWGYEQGSSLIKNDEKGISAVIVNSLKGKMYFEKIKNDIRYDQRKFDDVAKFNKSLLRSQEKSDSVDNFWRDFISGKDFAKVKDKYLSSAMTSMTAKHRIRLKYGNKFPVKQLVSLYTGFKAATMKIKLIYQILRLKICKLFDKKDCIFLFGLTEQANMGDIAQFCCIKKWLLSAYPECSLFCYRTSLLQYNNYNLIAAIKRIIGKNDRIFFMSGYNINDRGGMMQENMHHQAIFAFPNNEIIIMPQTITFDTEQGKKVAREAYLSHKKILLFARDKKSELIAKDMFPIAHVVPLADIVTTMIGKKDYALPRKGIMLCRRNDREKKYSDKQINELYNYLADIDSVELYDTLQNSKVDKVFMNPDAFIEKAIAKFASKRLTITDRLHGAVFSLIANTPVIILQTNDHKIDGLRHLSELFPNRAFFASDMNHAYALIKSILADPHYEKLDDIIQKEYYQKLNNTIANWEDDVLLTWETAK